MADEGYREALLRAERENFRLTLRVAELEVAQTDKTRDYVADYVAELTEADMERHRQAAWPGEPPADGWPPGVNKAEYFREYLGDRIPQAPAADETEDTEMHRQYRELVGEGGD